MSRFFFVSSVAIFVGRVRGSSNDFGFLVVISERSLVFACVFWQMGRLRRGRFECLLASELLFLCWPQKRKQPKTNGLRSQVLSSIERQNRSNRLLELSGDTSGASEVRRVAARGGVGLRT
jgi:hypothetical protein